MLATLVIHSTVVYNCKRTRATYIIRKTKLELLHIEIMVLATHSSYKKKKGKADIIFLLKNLSAKSGVITSWYIRFIWVPDRSSYPVNIYQLPYCQEPSECVFSDPETMTQSATLFRDQGKSKFIWFSFVFCLSQSSPGTVLLFLNSLSCMSYHYLFQ